MFGKENMSATPRAQRSSSKTKGAAAAAAAVSKTPTATSSSSSARNATSSAPKPFQSTKTNAQSKFDSRASFEKMEARLRALEGKAEEPALSATVPTSEPAVVENDATPLPPPAAADPAPSKVPAPPTSTKPVPPPPKKDARGGGAGAAAGGRFVRSNIKEALDKQAAAEAAEKNNNNKKKAPQQKLTTEALASVAGASAARTSSAPASESGSARSSQRGAGSKKAGMTAAERLASYDRLAKQVTRLESKVQPDASSSSTSAVAASPAPTDMATTTEHPQDNNSQSPSWRTSTNASAAPAASSSPPPSSSNLHEDNFPWPEPSARDNEVMSAPRGTLEPHGTGAFVYVFPKAGYFACKRCHKKIAGVDSKCSLEGGYAAFSKYCTENLRIDILVQKGATVIAVSCTHCLANVGVVNSVAGHLTANSGTLAHCTLEWGHEFAKPDDVFAHVLTEHDEEDDEDETLRESSVADVWKM